MFVKSTSSYFTVIEGERDRPWVETCFFIISKQGKRTTERDEMGDLMLTSFNGTWEYDLQVHQLVS